MTGYGKWCRRCGNCFEKEFKYQTICKKCKDKAINKRIKKQKKKGKITGYYEKWKTR